MKQSILTFSILRDAMKKVVDADLIAAPFYSDPDGVEAYPCQCQALARRLPLTGTA